MKKIREILFTRIKKIMTKKMYTLYYKENKNMMTKEEYEEGLRKSFKHLDYCKYKSKGWPCSTCPGCCFKGKEYDEMIRIMDFAKKYKEMKKQK